MVEFPIEIIWSEIFFVERFLTTDSISLAENFKLIKLFEIFSYFFNVTSCDIPFMSLIQTNFVLFISFLTHGLLKSIFLIDVDVFLA